MTLRDLIQLAGQHPLVLVVAFVVPPLLAGLLGQMHERGRGGHAPWRHFYAVLVYLTCVPGMFAGVITAYTLFFSRENLLDANLLVYFLPIVSMVATLIFIRKNVSFDEVPGFDRLSGLMVMAGCSFAVALIKWGTYRVFRRRDEPKLERPKLPGVE